MNILVVDHWFNHGGLFKLKTTDGEIELDHENIINISKLTNGKVKNIFFIAPQRTILYHPDSDENSDEPFQFRTVEKLETSLGTEKINYVFAGIPNLYTVMRNEGESTDPKIIFRSILAEGATIKPFLKDHVIELPAQSAGYKKRSYKSSKSKKRRNNTRRYKKKSSKRRSGKRV